MLYIYTNMLYVDIMLNKYIYILIYIYGSPKQFELSSSYKFEKWARLSDKTNESTLSPSRRPKDCTSFQLAKPTRKSMRPLASRPTSSQAKAARLPADLMKVDSRHAGKC